MAIRKFAFIKRSAIALIKDREENDLPTGQDWRLIEGISPEPQIGWVVLPDGSYVEPQPPDYWIESESLYDLFTPDEQETLEAIDNSKVKWFLRQLIVRRYVPVVPKLQTIINAIESAGIIGTGRASEIISAAQLIKVSTRTP